MRARIGNLAKVDEDEGSRNRFDPRLDIGPVSGFNEGRAEPGLSLDAGSRPCELAPSVTAD